MDAEFIVQSLTLFPIEQACPPVTLGSCLWHSCQRLSISSLKIKLWFLLSLSSLCFTRLFQLLCLVGSPIDVWYGVDSLREPRGSRRLSDIMSSHFLNLYFLVDLKALIEEKGYEFYPSSDQPKRALKLGLGIKHAIISMNGEWHQHELFVLSNHLRMRQCIILPICTWLPT